MTVPNAARNETAPSQQIGNAFVAILPAITEVVRFAFRRQRADRRQELVSAAIANAFVAFRRLAARGRLDLVYPTVLARFAVQQTCEGRRIGCRQNSKDALSDHAQKRRRFRVFGLNDEVPGTAGWRQIVVEDKRASPAETAIFRIDFPAWLDQLSPRMRAVAMVLAVGHTPGEAAQQFCVGKTRISQLRRELQNSWLAFHGEPVAA